MSENGTNVGGWPAISMRTFVNNDIYNLLPIELKNTIIDTTVVSSHGSNDSSNFTSTDKLYLLAPKEIYSNFSDTNDTAKDLTRTLDYYTALGVTTSNYSGAIKKNETGAYYWWLRSAVSSIHFRFYAIHNSIGRCDDGLGGNAYGVSPAFRLG